MFPDHNYGLFNLADAENICKLLSDTKKYDGESYNDYYRRILAICGLQVSMNYVEPVRHIHRRKAYKKISCNYDF